MDAILAPGDLTAYAIARAEEDGHALRAAVDALTGEAQIALRAIIPREPAADDIVVVTKRLRDAGLGTPSLPVRTVLARAYVNTQAASARRKRLDALRKLVAQAVADERRLVEIAGRSPYFALFTPSPIDSAARWRTALRQQIEEEAATLDIKPQGGAPRRDVLRECVKALNVAHRTSPMLIGDWLHALSIEPSVRRRHQTEKRENAATERNRRTAAVKAFLRSAPAK
jgi:hypothetical protein